MAIDRIIDGKIEHSSLADLKTKSTDLDSFKVWRHSGSSVQRQPER